MDVWCLDVFWWSKTERSVAYISQYTVVHTVFPLMAFYSNTTISEWNVNLLLVMSG